MRLEWDEAKRQATLDQRRLDFADAAEVFAGFTLTVEDDRRDYGETRFQTVGQVARDVVMIVWTWRGDMRRVISMRKCDDRERARYEQAASGRR
jgi:uncharacterized DUF497 family protein